MPSARYVISEFTTVSWRDGIVQIASPVSRTAFTTRDASLLDLLATFGEPRAACETGRESVVAEWIAAGILIDAGVSEPAAVQHWDRESLALHVSSRERRLYFMREPATPAVAPRRGGLVIPLAESPGRSSGVADLAALLAARRSRRVWGSTPLGFQTFSDLLWLSARNRSDRNEGHVSRPYPSGGAAYTLEIYPVLAEGAVDALQCGVYRYLPGAHALEIVSASNFDATPFLDAAGRSMASTPPPAVLLVTSRYARQSEVYAHAAYPLVLKEAGCLFQTLYLVAEALGLAACALGGRSPFGRLAELCGTTEIEEPLVGEFAIGARAAP